MAIFSENIFRKIFFKKEKIIFFKKFKKIKEFQEIFFEKLSNFFKNKKSFNFIKNFQKCKYLQKLSKENL